MKHSMLAFALLVATHAPSIARAAEPSRATAAHLVRSAAGEDVLDAEPGQLPSAAHLEGTVLAIVSAPLGSGNVVEIDVENGAVIHRSGIACSRILRAGTRVFAMCGDDVDELDANLELAARMTPSGCPVGRKRRSLRLATDGATRVVSAFTCDDVVHLRVMDTFGHRVLGDIDSHMPIEPRESSRLTMQFQGQTISGVIPASPYLHPQSFVLSADYRRIRFTALPAAMSDTYPSAPVTADHPSPPLPSGLGGEYVEYELRLGDIRLFMTRTGGGGGHEAGLYAAALAR